MLKKRQTLLNIEVLVDLSTDEAKERLNVAQNQWTSLEEKGKALQEK